MGEAMIETHVGPVCKLLPTKRKRPKPKPIPKSVRALFSDDDTIFDECLGGRIIAARNLAGDRFAPVLIECNGTPRIVPLVPALEVPTFAHGLSHDGARCVIAPGPDVYEVDVMTGKTTKHRAREGRVILIAFVGEHIALTRHLMGEHRIHFIDPSKKVVAKLATPADPDKLCMLAKGTLLLLRNASYGGSYVFDIKAGKPRRVATVNEEVVDAYDLEGTAILELESGRFELHRDA